MSYHTASTLPLDRPLTVEEQHMLRAEAAQQITRLNRENATLLTKLYAYRAKFGFDEEIEIAISGRPWPTGKEVLQAGK